MKKISTFLAAATFVAATAVAAPAFAHGGAGGGGGAPSLQKMRTEAAAKSCKESPNKCIGFGSHYYGE